MIGSKEAKRIEKLLQEFGGTNLYITNYANVAYEIPYGTKLVLPETYWRRFYEDISKIR